MQVKLAPLPSMLFMTNIALAVILVFMSGVPPDLGFWVSLAGLLAPWGLTSVFSRASLST